MADREAVRGWKEATIAWAVAASIHREYCRGRDPFYKTRQADYARHEAEARAKLRALMEEGYGGEKGGDSGKVG